DEPGAAGDQAVHSAGRLDPGTQKRGRGAQKRSRGAQKRAWAPGNMRWRPQTWRARTARAVRARPKDDPGRAGGRPMTREKGGDARGPVPTSVSVSSIAPPARAPSSNL